MACPTCGCKVSYQYDSGWDGDAADENLERCAACGEVFDIADSEPEDDGPTPEEWAELEANARR